MVVEKEFLHLQTNVQNAEKENQHQLIEVDLHMPKADFGFSL
jgi:CheY-like chemotaxis protein